MCMCIDVCIFTYAQLCIYVKMSHNFSMLRFTAILFPPYTKFSIA